MLHHRIAVAALAALFGTAVTGSALVSGAIHTAAYADNEGEHGDHHDNGQHKGWYKHHNGDDQGENRGNGNHGYGAAALRGTIVGINGTTLGLRLGDGRVVTVNDQNALNAGNAPNLYVGETVYVRGGFGQDGVFYANRIAGNGSNGGYNGGYYGNAGNCNVNASGLVTVAGYERGGFDGSTFILRQPLINGIPIGTDYTILVNGSTCVQRALGSSGEHVTVVGVPMNDGHTIQAIRITG
jgi:hypothetical protein